MEITAYNPPEGRLETRDVNDRVTDTRDDIEYDSRKGFRAEFVIKEDCRVRIKIKAEWYWITRRPMEKAARGV